MVTAPWWRGVHAVPVRCRRWPASTTLRAPCVRRERRYRWPCLVIAPRRRRVPLECSRGVSPSQLANCRPRRNAWMCPTLATSAVAVKSPTPGTSKQPLRSRVVGRKGRELLFHRLNAGFALAELRVDESQGGAQVDRQRKLRVFEQPRELRQDGPRPQGQRDAVFAQQAPDGSGAGRHPLLPHARCNATSACCSGRFTAPGTTVPLRAASTNASTSVRPVFCRRT